MATGGSGTISGDSGGLHTSVSLTSATGTRNKAWPQGCQGGLLEGRREASKTMSMFSGDRRYRKDQVVAEMSGTA